MWKLIIKLVIWQRSYITPCAPLVDIQFAKNGDVCGVELYPSAKIEYIKNSFFILFVHLFCLLWAIIGVLLLIS